MAKDMKREGLIRDRGYNAVRQMAREMVSNGATLADILFHANQVWHEFKAAAADVPGVIQTGTYIHQYDAQASNKIILADPNYKRNGIDEARVAQYVAELRAGAAATATTVEGAVKVAIEIDRKGIKGPKGRKKSAAAGSGK